MQKPSLNHRIKEAQARNRFLREPLPGPDFPDWAWDRINAEIAPKRTIFRRTLVRLIPQAGFIKSDWLPPEMAEKVAQWNAWFLSERSRDAYTWWIVISVLGWFLSTVPPYSNLLNILVITELTVKVLATFGLVAAFFYWRIWTAHVELKSQIWDKDHRN